MSFECVVSGKWLSGVEKCKGQFNHQISRDLTSLCRSGDNSEPEASTAGKAEEGTTLENMRKKYGKNSALPRRHDVDNAKRINLEIKRRFKNTQVGSSLFVREAWRLFRGE